MSAELRWRKPRSPEEVIPELAMFLVSLGFAWWLDWRTTDLVWSTWLAGLVVGLAAILAGLVGDWRRWEGNQAMRGVVVGAKGLWYVGRFVGFSWLVGFWIGVVAPLAGMRPGDWSLSFWSVLLAEYWPMLLLAAVAERRMLCGAARAHEELGPFLPMVRTWVIIIPLTGLMLFGAMTKLFTIDQLVCYTLVAVAYFSPWRLGREEERS